MNGKPDNDITPLLQLLANDLPPAEAAALLRRLQDDASLCDLYLTLAYEEAVIHEWVAQHKSDQADTWPELPQRESFAPDANSVDSRLRWPDRGRGRWPRIGRIALSLSAALLLLLLPAAAVLMAARIGGDFSLALPGWTASVDVALWNTSAVALSIQTLAWMFFRRLGLLYFPRFAGLGGAALMLLCGVSCQTTISELTERESLRREELIQDHVWVSYDSAYYWPADLAAATGHAAQEPTTNQIRAELATLRKAGFTGLYIHECRDGQVEVPKLAREAGFAAIVQGIRVADPRDLDAPATRRQIRNVLNIHRHLDAICLGDLRARDVDLAALKQTLAELRQRTGKPVTTSFLQSDYLGQRGQRLRELEDFTLRALDRPWRDAEGDPEVAVAAVRQALESFRADDKPTLLTFVFFPSGGGPKYSEDSQAQFFQEVRSLTMPRGVNVVYFNSFDRPWAKRLSEVSDATPAFESHTGLFRVEPSANGEWQFVPKRAVNLFRAGAAYSPAP